MTVLIFDHTKITPSNPLGERRCKWQAHHKYTSDVRKTIELVRNGFPEWPEFGFEESEGFEEWLGNLPDHVVRRSDTWGFKGEFRNETYVIQFFCSNPDRDWETISD